MENLTEDTLVDIMRYVKHKNKTKIAKNQYFTGVSGKKLWRLTRCIYCYDPRAWTIANKDGNFYHFTIYIYCKCYH